MDSSTLTQRRSLTVAELDDAAGHHLAGAWALAAATATCNYRPICTKAANVQFVSYPRKDRSYVRAPDVRDYEVCNGWNWRSAAAIGTSLGSLVLPMPLWMRMLAARGMLTRTALRADSCGIAGNCHPLELQPDGRVPWHDITHILVWKFNYLTIVAVARRNEPVVAGLAADTSPTSRERGSRKKQEALKRRQARRKSRVQSGTIAEPLTLSFPLLMTPDGMPSRPDRLITVTGRDVNVGLLTAASHRLAPSVRVVDLTHHAWIPPDLDLRPNSYPYSPQVRELTEASEYVKTLFQILHRPVRRLLWALGVALSVRGIVSASSPMVVVVSGLAFLLLAGRLAFVWRRRLRSWRKMRESGPIVP